MSNQNLTALYDTRGAAETAVEGLKQLGIDGGDITIRGTEDNAGEVSTAQEPKGLLESLADFFVPDEDLAAYEEGVRRGHWLVTARVADERAEQALEILERSEPVDLGERAESWRLGGWGGAAGTAARGAAPAGSAADDDTARSPAEVALAEDRLDFETSEHPGELRPASLAQAQEEAARGPKPRVRSYALSETGDGRGTV